LPVLIILAVLWAVVLLPPLLRSRSQRTADSIVDFNYKLDMLGQTNGNRRRFRRHASMSPPDLESGAPAFGPLTGGPQNFAPPMVPGLHISAAARSAKRRREVLQVLGFAFLGSLLIAVLAGSTLFWALQIFVDLLALAYLGLWAWARNIQAERAEKVRYMPELRTPELVLRRSASS